MNRRKMMGAAVALVLAGAGVLGKWLHQTHWPSQGSATSAQTGVSNANSVNAALAQNLTQAIQHHQSHVNVAGQGVVVRVLPEDRQGAPHQKFILKLPSGDTVLVAHNLSLAPRAPLKPGDEVAFQGEFAWNAQGGVVHWTHRDPAHRHQDGWLRWRGQVYQ